MSLLEGRQRVLVFPYARVEDEWGDDSQVVGEPVVVRCTVKWQSAGEAADLSVSPATAVKLIGRSWPGAENCRFEWRGYVFEQVGPTQYFTGSPRTAHFEAYGRVVAVEGGWDGLPDPS